MAWPGSPGREEPAAEEYRLLGVPPGIVADKAAPYRAQQAQAAAAGADDSCYLGRPWWSWLSRSPGATTTCLAGGATSAIGCSGPSRGRQAEVTWPVRHYDVVSTFGWLEPVEADDRTSQQHELDFRRS
jgi:hypothetical protein